MSFLEKKGKFKSDYNIKKSIRELEGALTKLNAYSKLTKQEITLEIAEKELQKQLSETEDKIAYSRQFYKNKAH